MADLARYFDQTPRQAVLTPISTAFVGSEAVGQAVSQAGQLIDNYAQDQEAFWVQQQMSDLEAYGRDQWNTLTTNAQDGAAGFESNYLGAIDSRYDEIRNSAPSNRARRALESQMITFRDGQANAANGFAKEEEFQFRKYTILQNADQLSQDLYRNPGVPAWQPQGSLMTTPGLGSDFAPFKEASGFYSTGVNDPIGGLSLPDNISAFSSQFYSPRDFADSKTGDVAIGQRTVKALDWVTEQFGYGKLQINSGFRSGATNLAVAESGEHGPHTKGQSLDVQVRHLPQAEKDRLYSLFKAAGANSFGFGEGTMHVEWREGQGNGRNGDFEWTYGSAAKYNLVPVASPDSRASVASAIPQSTSQDMANLRPFQSWEYRDNADGSKSSELTTTYQDATGQWVNAPSLWRNSDGWVELDEEQQQAAVQAYEQSSGEAFPRYATLEEAEAAAEERSHQGGAAAGSYNQYPYLQAVALTANNETGTGDLAQASLQIAKEADGTISVGALGLNSSGLLGSFLNENGAALGITATPGSPEFAAQWETAVRRDPEGVIGMQLQFHETHVVQPARSSMQAMGAGAVANDPRAIAFTSDLIVQYGPQLARKHIAAGKGSGDVASYISAITASTKASLQSDFVTAISADPSVTQGLYNRIDRRAAGAMASGPGGAVATGNIPVWNGPIPAIEDSADFGGRLARIDAMVDTIGGTPAQRRDVRDQLRGQVVRSWLTSVSQTNPSAAMAVLMSGRYDNDLSVGDMAAQMNGAQAAYEKFDAIIRQSQRDIVDGLKSEASQLFADEIASVSTTGAGLGRISESHMAVASEKEKSDLAFAQFAYTAGRQIATASNDEIPAILEANRPEGEGFAEEQRRYDYVREQIAKRQEMLTNDPAAYVLGQSQELGAAFQTAMANNDPNAIASAIRATRAAQERMGVPAGMIKSLPQTAVASFEELLTKPESADEAFANLLQMRSMLGTEADAVLGEMESTGLGQGWRQAGQLVGAGHMMAAKSLTRVVHAGEYGADVELGVRLAMDGKPSVARKIFDGRLRRKEIPGLMPTGKDQDLDLTMKQAVGQHLGDAVGTDGAMFDAVREAALSLYAADLPFGASLDAAKVEDAIDAVTGGVLEWNSDGETGKFIAPQAGMTQQQFNDGVWQLDDEALADAFVGYASEDTPLTRDDLASIQFESAGNGLYFLNWPGNGLARKEDGSPFVLNYARAVQASRDRSLQKVLDTQVGINLGEVVVEADQPVDDIDAMRAQMNQITGAQ